jgi:Mg/Co/Ni transporter MgtE
MNAVAHAMPVRDLERTLLSSLSMSTHIRTICYRELLRREFIKGLVNGAVVLATICIAVLACRGVINGTLLR